MGFDRVESDCHFNLRRCGFGMHGPGGEKRGGKGGGREGEGLQPLMERFLEMRDLEAGFDWATIKARVGPRGFISQ